MRVVVITHADLEEQTDANDVADCVVAVALSMPAALQFLDEARVELAELFELPLAEAPEVDISSVDGDTFVELTFDSDYFVAKWHDMRR